jgi:hypothetical protein
VRAAQSAIAALHFPLGCPAPGHDLADVTAALDEWLLRDAQRLEDQADDAALDLLEGV